MFLISLDVIDIKSTTVLLFVFVYSVSNWSKFFGVFKHLKYSWNFLKKIIAYETILHSACESGSIGLVKYVLSLGELNVNVETIFFKRIFK